MQISEVEVDPYGRLAGHDIHDAFVKEFHFVESEGFDVYLGGEAGAMKLISLRYVSRIGIKDLVNGSIISDIFCWKIGDSVTTQDMLREAWRVLLGGNYVEGDFQGLIDKLAAQYADQLLVFFESSYGGSIAAICRDMRTD